LAGGELEVSGVAPKDRWNDSAKKRERLRNVFEAGLNRMAECKIALEKSQNTLNPKDGEKR
jgi:hypothetical protein